MTIQPRRGIALVASLFVLAAVFVLGAGSLFLANANLNLASNQLRHLLAKSHAEAGMEAALIVLNAAATTPETLTSLPSLPVQSGGPVTFTVARYVPTETSVELSVVGTAPGGARYQTDAVLVPLVASDAGPGSSVPVGIVSETALYAKKVLRMTNAQIHANLTLEILDHADGFWTCDADGGCTQVASGSLPVTGAAGATCSVTGISGVCSGGTVSTGHTTGTISVPAPPIDDVVSDAFARPLPTSSADPLCGQTVNGRTLQCYNGPVSLGSQTGVDIVVFGNVTFSGVSLIDTHVLTLSGGDIVLRGNTRVEGSVLVAADDVTQEGELRAGLDSTIAAYDDISLTGNIYTATTSASDPLGVAFMSGDDFYSGNAIEKTVISGSDQERAAAFIWAGGDVKLDNKANLLGGILAKGTIDFTSNDVTIYGSGALVEGYFTDEEVIGFAFGSRR